MDVVGSVYNWQLKMCCPLGEDENRTDSVTEEEVQSLKHPSLH